MATEVVSVITVVILLTVGSTLQVTTVEIVDVRVEVVAVPSDVMRLLVGTMLLVDSAVVEISVVASVVIWVATEVVSGITVVIRVDASIVIVGLVDSSEVTTVEIVDVRVEVWPFLLSDQTARCYSLILL